MAQFSCSPGKRLVYTYTTPTGQSDTYQTTSRSTGPVEVTYDPRNPATQERSIQGEASRPRLR
ncbi:hypothetical protein OG399_45510 [Streptomyces achromogenes]